MASSRVARAVVLLCVTVVASSSSSVFYPGQFLDESSFSEHGVLVMGSNVHGKLDVFLDLADPQCAKAWPTLKRAVRDNENIMEFVFHAVPLAANPIAVDYAKAAYVIAEHSGDAEVETFFDLVFSSHSSRERNNLASLHDDTDGDRVRHQEARVSMEDLEDLDLLAALVQSSSSMTSDQYRSGMRDAVFDDFFRQGKKTTTTSSSSSSSSSSPSSTLSTYLPVQGGTPAVYLDGEFMAYLDGEDALENFKLFLSSGLLSKISDANHRRHGGVASRYPLWLKLQDVLRMLDDVRQDEERLDQDGTSSTEYNEPDPYRLYADSKDSSDAVAAARAAYDDDTTLRSSELEDEEEEEEEEDEEDKASSVKSATLVVNDFDETSAPLSPSSASEPSSQFPATLPRHSSADFYFYDDTSWEIREEQAIEDGGKRPSPPGQPMAKFVTADQAQPLPPPQSPSSVTSGPGVSDESKRESEHRQQQQADSIVSPSFSLSPPAQVIA